MEVKSKSKSLKEEIKLSADEYQKQLEKQVVHSVHELKRIGYVSLLFGGALLAGYALTKYLKKGKNGQGDDLSEKPEQNTILDTLVSAGTEIATVYILNFAKKKLGEYIKGLNKLERKSHDSTSGTSS
jgi:hypothetical protein